MLRLVGGHLETIVKPVLKKAFDYFEGFEEINGCLHVATNSPKLLP